MDEYARQRKKMHLQNFDYSAEGYLCFLTICCYEKQPIFSNLAIADFILNELEHRNDNRNAAICCYTIMPDHLHAVVALKSGYGGTLQNWVSAFKSFTAKAIKNDFGIRQLWQKNFYEHIIRDEESLSTITGYILNNPVRKGIVDRWEEYPYSKILMEL